MVRFGLEIGNARHGFVRRGMFWQGKDHSASRLTPVGLFVA
jgi:hypothetical protein